MMACLVKPSKNHAYSIKKKTKNKQKNTHVATSAGLSAKNIQKPCTSNKKHNKNKKTTQRATIFMTN